MPTFAEVKEQMDRIRDGALEIIPEDGLVQKLERSRHTGKPLVIKQGFDPTRPDLHIGHAVSMRKLRTFQELGHDVVFVVGDYTGRVGDPSGRSDTRPRLSGEEIDRNARTYAEQAGRILDVQRVRIEYNSTWLAPLDLARILELTATYTVARMLERDDFAKRYAEGRPISMVEFMYPLLQAFDSVALNADVELGGTDQKFNLLVGRTVQERFGQEPQVCLIMPLLRGTDGDQKMSKSYDNYIGIAEPPEEQFGKTMSIPDELIEEWLRLAVPSVPGDDVEALIGRARAKPYEAKRDLARRIVTQFHGVDAASAAEAHFDRLFREGGVPDDIPTVEVSLSLPAVRHEAGSVRLAGLIVAAGLASSNSEATRLLEQGAVTVDDQRVTDRNSTLPVEDGHEPVIRRGKRHFARVRFVP